MQSIDEGLLNKSNSYIQTIMYGISAWAKRVSTNLFEIYAEKIINSIYEVIDAPDSLNLENIECTEDAIGSLFWVCLYKSDCKYVTNEHMIKCLNHMPLTYLVKTSKFAHKLFWMKLKDDGKYLIFYKTCSTTI